MKIKNIEKFITTEEGMNIYIKEDVVEIKMKSNGDKIVGIINEITDVGTLKLDCSKEFKSKIITVYINSIDEINFYCNY